MEGASLADRVYRKVTVLFGQQDRRGSEMTAKDYKERNDGQ